MCDISSLLSSVVVVDVESKDEFRIDDVYTYRLYPLNEDLMLEFMVFDGLDSFQTSTWSLRKYTFYFN